MAAKPKIKKSEITLLLMSGACVVGYLGYRVVNPSAPGVDLGKAGINIPAGVQLTGGGAGAPLLGGGEPPAPIEELPAARRDPFTPLAGSVEPVPTPAGGSPPAAQTAAPSLPPAVARETPVPQREVPPPAPKVEVPPQPATLVGTILGQESLATFEYGPLVVERRLGEHVGPYRIAEIDHGRVRLVHKNGGESWLMSGQTLTEVGVTVKAESSHAAPAAVTLPAESAPAPTPDPSAPEPGRRTPKARPSTLPLATRPAAEPFFVAQEPTLGGPLPLMREAFPGE